MVGSLFFAARIIFTRRSYALPKGGRGCGKTARRGGAAFPGIFRRGAALFPRRERGGGAGGCGAVPANGAAVALSVLRALVAARAERCAAAALPRDGGRHVPALRCERRGRKRAHFRTAGWVSGRRADGRGAVRTRRARWRSTSSRCSRDFPRWKTNFASQIKRRALRRGILRAERFGTG